MELGMVLTDPAGPSEHWRDVVSAARAAEEAGLDSLWCGDHLLLGDAPVLDSGLVLATAAAATTRVQIGSAVFLPSLRPLAWAAKQVATLSVLAGADRFQLGIGLGAGPEEEYLVAGVERSERARRTDAFLEALPDLLAGRQVRLPVQETRRDVKLSPSVAMPRVWIGGSSPAALRRAVRFGDGWLAGLLTPEEFSRAAEQLRALADEAGRPCPRLGLMVHAGISDTDPSGAWRTTVDVLCSSYGLPAQQAEQIAVGGSTAEVARQLDELVERGAEHLVVLSDLTPWSDSCRAVASARDQMRSAPRPVVG